MTRYKLIKDLGKFKEGSTFQGMPTDELSVVEKDQGVYCFVKTYLADENYFKEIETCETCGQVVGEVVRFDDLPY